MITAFMEDYVVYGLYWVLVAAWRAIPLIAVVLLADWLLGRRLAARFQCLLWALVVMRLGVAVTLPAPFSVHGPLDRLAAGLLESDPAPVNTIEVVSVTGETFSYVADEAATRASAVPAEMYASAPRAAVAPASWPWEEILAWLILGGWAIVFAALCLRGVAQYVRFQRTLSRQPDIAHQATIDELLRVCDALDCRRRPRLKETDQVDVPAVFGFWRPVICLPVGLREELSPSDLKLILQHEVAHIVRHDALVLSLAGVVRAAQWFNPLAWLAFARLRSSIERAADERALRGATRTTLREYGELLLRFSTGGLPPRRPASVGLLFMSARRRLTERITGLDQVEQSYSLSSRVLGLSLATALLATGLFDGAEADDNAPATPAQAWVDVRLPDANGSLPLVEQPQAPQQPEQPREKRTFDVTAALNKLQKTMRGTPEEITRHLASHFIASGSLPEIVDGQMTLTDTQESHRNTQSMLDAIAKGGTVQITIDCRAIHANLSVADDFDWILPNGQDYPEQSVATIGQQPPQISLPEFPEERQAGSDIVQLTTTEHNLHMRPSIRMKISDFQMRLLLRRCEKGAENNVMHAPRITTFNGQRAAIMDAQQRPFVVGLEERKEGQRSALQPVIRIFEDGWTMNVSCVATEDHSIDLRCAINESEILDVELVDLPGRGGDRATIQLPTVREHRIQSAVRLEEGESLLIASPEPRSAGQPAGKTMARFYLLTPRIISGADVVGDEENQTLPSPTERRYQLLPPQQEDPR